MNFPNKESVLYYHHFWPNSRFAVEHGMTFDQNKTFHSGYIEWQVNDSYLINVWSLWKIGLKKRISLRHNIHKIDLFRKKMLHCLGDNADKLLHVFLFHFPLNKSETKLIIWLHYYYEKRRSYLKINKPPWKKDDTIIKALCAYCLLLLHFVLEFFSKEKINFLLLQTVQ